MSGLQEKKQKGQVHAYKAVTQDYTACVLTLCVESCYLYDKLMLAFQVCACGARGQVAGLVVLPFCMCALVVCCKLIPDLVFGLTIDREL